MNCTGFAFIFAMLECATPVAPAIQAAPFCSVYEPIYWSANDTRQTKEQVDKMNAVWKRLCVPKNGTKK